MIHLTTMINRRELLNTNNVISVDSRDSVASFTVVSRLDKTIFFLEFILLVFLGSNLNNLTSFSNSIVGRSGMVKIPRFSSSNTAMIQVLSCAGLNRRTSNDFCDTV